MILTEINIYNHKQIVTSCLRGDEKLPFKSRRPNTLQKTPILFDAPTIVNNKKEVLYHVRMSQLRKESAKKRQL